MSLCPWCGRTSPPETETGYSGPDYRSADCEEKDAAWKRAGELLLNPDAELTDEEWNNVLESITGTYIVYDEENKIWRLLDDR